jgi:thiol:disulfide interchange protein
VSDTQVPSPDITAAPPRPRWRRLEPLLWVGLFAVVLVVQWPMLKGWFYRTAGTAPPPASFTWVTSLEAGLAQAQRDGRPVFVDFQASWCPPCIAMQHDVWPDARVGQLLTERYVPVSIDVDADPEGASIRYGVRAIPTILLLSPDGQVLERATYMGRGALVRFLEEHAGRAGRR